MPQAAGGAVPAEAALSDGLSGVAVSEEKKVGPVAGRVAPRAFAGDSNGRAPVDRHAASCSSRPCWHSAELLRRWPGSGCVQGKPRAEKKPKEAKEKPAASEKDKVKACMVLTGAGLALRRVYGRAVRRSPDPCQAEEDHQAGPRRQEERGLRRVVRASVHGGGAHLVLQCLGVLHPPALVLHHLGGHQGLLRR